MHGVPVVERDVPHVSLHLLQRQADAVMVVVGDGVVRRELDKVVRLELDDVGEEVAALEGEVLHDEVERVAHAREIVLLQLYAHVETSKPVARDGELWNAP